MFCICKTLAHSPQAQAKMKNDSESTAPLEVDAAPAVTAEKPPREPKRNRCLRATDSEWREIGQRARAVGLTRTDYLLSRVLKTRPKARVDQPTRDAIYQLARIGNNLNQLTHAANTPNNLVVESELRSTLAAVLAWIEAHG